MMEEQRTTSQSLMSKLDRLIDINLDCQKTKIRVAETRIRGLQEARRDQGFNRRQQTHPPIKNPLME